MEKSILQTVIRKLWKERYNLTQLSASTDERKKDQRERLKIITDDLYKFIELYEKNNTDERQQKIDLLELKIDKELGFIDNDTTEY